ncbi:tyrosine-protein kinase STYK1 isoform X3 [Nerophis ophidion]|uniref:tyrosine-protein kinase STYK1 isoform X3 n=1 Tax=Nerophis ophidion TaxID=159077 RepID=UPI002ADF789D|nr:tyrosine-protein kinase STYK1 isoform X3 [Nerophis ophidion]
MRGGVAKHSDNTCRCEDRQRCLTPEWAHSMANNSTNSSDTCATGDNLCIVRTEQQAVIIVPTLLLLFTLITVLFMIVHSYLSRNRTRTTVPARYSSSVRRPERRLQGIDAPPGIDPLEHEELPMAVHKAQQRSRKAVPQVTTGGRIGSFQQVTVLPQTLYIKTNEMVGIYKARMDNRNVVLRALKDTANSDERQRFLDFASFVSGLGRHPFIPALLGVITASSPPVMVMEELRHRDLLGFLWRCRRGESACDMTERTVFTMATQVASALVIHRLPSCRLQSSCSSSREGDASNVRPAAPARSSPSSRRAAIGAPSGASPWRHSSRSSRRGRGRPTGGRSSECPSPWTRGSTCGRPDTARPTTTLCCDRLTVLDTFILVHSVDRRGRSHSRL